MPAPTGTAIVISTFSPGTARLRSIKVASTRSISSWLTRYLGKMYSSAVEARWVPFSSHIVSAAARYFSTYAIEPSRPSSSPENKMKRILQRMVEKGLLETVPELKGNKTSYQLKKK